VSTEAPAYGPVPSAAIVTGASIPNPHDPKLVHHVFGGGESNPSWDEYLISFRPEVRSHIRAIRNAVESAGFVGMKGEEAGMRDIAFLVSGHYWIFSWRAWGDLMQSIDGNRHGWSAYYMT
jgi:hypothetical protein